MRVLDALRVLNDISSFQKGLFTTAQAKRVGVERHTLSNLERRGIIERLAKGVYRMGGVPSAREEEVFAVWLSINPGRIPGDLQDQNAPVAMGATAAWLLELGEVGPTPYEFSTRVRKQTKRHNLVLRKRSLDGKDVTIVDGIPTTTPSRTVLDLIDYGEDLSIVANVLNDAFKNGLVEQEAELIAEIDKRGVKEGVFH
jgi:predicted transcriptional regulator of viral defense system